jgi:hypothetical protein
MFTASLLFSGLSEKGNNHCYYCGAFCDDEFEKNDYVKDTFTNRDIVKYPISNFVCGGCVESLGAGPDELLMIDGEIKKRGNDRGMQPRMYSWIITKNKKLAATKAHIAYLRETILNPPQPPFCVILADSGQKQLIFRSFVSMSRDYFPVMLEEEIIFIHPDKLMQRIQLANKLCAAIGKPALLINCKSIQYAIICEKYFGDIKSLEQWLTVMNEPMSRLAAWLSKNKEDSQNEYPAIERGGIPPEACGAHRPVEKNGRNGADGNKGRDCQLHIDFA